MQSFNEVWNLVLEKMKNDFSETVITLWFNELKLVTIKDTIAILSINSDFKRDIIEKKYADSIIKYIKEILEYDVTLTICSTENGNGSLDRILDNGGISDVESKLTEKYPNTFDFLNEKMQESEEPTFYTIGGNSEQGDQTSYKSVYTFENFIVGSSNKFAHAACTAVANAPATSYNPLFIYGSSGLGKTHLLYAITNEICKKTPMVNIIYIKGEEFTNQLIDSITRKNPVPFRDKYRKADVLLIDDIQFIAGKESTQEEFFHTFNALYEEHKQIILTSDRPPRDIKTLEDRLKTRFEWGLIVDIQPPDLELRVAILKKKALSMGVEVPNDVLAFLGHQLRSNIRQIEGAIKKLGALSLINGTPITMEVAENSISDILMESEQINVNLDKIFYKVSKKFGISIEDLKGRKRTKDVALARHVFIYIMRRLTDMSFPAIGKILSRDHTTILSSSEFIENELQNNPIFEIEINELIQEIREQF